jgi:GTP-binding protein HflX
MEYTYPRLARMWGHLERIASGAGGGMGIGTRGPGETQLETDRRLVRKRIADLRGDIHKIQDRKTRLVAERTRQHFTVCIVGYTNAGKSTLFNTLTAAGTYADDKLFATLDTKTRAWKLERGTEALLSDTVGFVRDLPHNLVASFKATLEEAVHADLLLHVLDVGHPHAQQQFESVHQVLEEIGVKGKDEILLLNKTDTPEGEENFPFWRALVTGSIPISAKTGLGLHELNEAVYRFVRGQQVEVTLEADVTNGRLLSFIESHTRVQGREFIDGRIRVTAVMGKQSEDGEWGRLKRVDFQSPNGPRQSRGLSGESQTASSPDSTAPSANLHLEDRTVGRSGPAFALLSLIENEQFDTGLI